MHFLRFCVPLGTVLLLGSEASLAQQAVLQDANTASPVDRGRYLIDSQVAAVSNFIRGSWGNRAAPVRAAEVTRQR